MARTADRPASWPLPLVRAGGPARDRGVTIGRALKAQITAHIAAWRRSLPADGDPDGYVARLLAETDFKPAIHRHAPDLLAELEGIAAGAGQPADQLYALQLLDEEWAWRTRRLMTAAPPKCSSLAAVNADGSSWLAQNMDLGDYTDGFQVMLHVDDCDHPSALVFSTAGMIGLMGVNAAGLGVCVNSLPQLPSAPEGMPVAFVLRRLLQAENLAEAANLVQALPHAANQHYLIAEPGAARSFEAGAAGVTEYRPVDSTSIFHTNHPLAAKPALPEAPISRENSEARLASLVARLSGGAAGLEEIEAALCAKDDPRHPVCRAAPAPAFGPATITTGSMISLLQSGGVRSWASAGPPDARGYAAFRLRSRSASSRSKRAWSIAGSALFFLVAPGFVAGLAPYWITSWKLEPAMLGVQAVRWIGAALMLMGAAGLIDSFARFAVQGLGTPAPPFPTERLVATGLYRYVRNPMYIAVIGSILGQALLLSSAALLAYGAVVWLAFHVFVVAYEEPALTDQFGPSYAAYRANVPRWIPRLRARRAPED